MFLTVISCLDIKKLSNENTQGVIEIGVNDYYREYLDNGETLHYLNNNEKMTGEYHVIQNNSLKEIMHLANGLLFDTNKVFYPNGKLAQEISYRRGIKVGEEKFYYRTGELKMRQKYSNNEKSGKPIYYEKDGNITIENEYKDGKIYRNGILIGEEYEYEHKEKGMLDVIKIYETDGSNKVKLIMAYPQDDEMILFILDENHNITDSINPDKNPEKLMMIAQKIGFNFME